MAKEEVKKTQPVTPPVTPKVKPKEFGKNSAAKTNDRVQNRNKGDFYYGT